jgi:hypothetical protein
MRCVRLFKFLRYGMAIALKGRYQALVPPARRSGADERNRKRPGVVRHSPI